MPIAGTAGQPASRSSAGRWRASRIHRLYALAHLQILHLWGLANMIVSKDWQVNTEAGVQYLAENLVRFIAENE